MAALKFDKTRLIFGLFLIVLIIIGEIVFAVLKVPSWPAFMIMVFFFVEHMDKKKAPNILVGGLFGIACIVIAKYFVEALTPVIGGELAKLSFIVIIVYAIVAFGEMLPILFNNYAFMYLIVSAVAIKTPDPNPFIWMAVEVVGGGIFIAGILGIIKIIGAMAKRKAAKASK
jgi:hypothetical protein